MSRAGYLFDALSKGAQASPARFDPIKAGALEVRLADSAAEIDAAQALRYRVFFEEMAAHPSAEAAAAKRDRDAFDEYCDHLLVVDHKRGASADGVVGTYRLLRRSAAEKGGGFYSATEFDIAPLIAYPGEILELGRSCVDRAYRTRPTMQLLWRGIASYVFQHDITLMFGCASLPGTDPKALAVPLSYLHHNHLAPPSLRARALPDRYVEMNLLPPGEVDADAAVAQIDARSAIAALPPLIKGYLRLGGLVGEGAVIDHQFNTTDVCIIVVTDRVTEKYFSHYQRQAGGEE
ncbi:MAG TPA: GNAT family N-acyltransferase [Alphaproteobacteria bacterium]|nr:GNAT family N-acyltransferase [Alphaproteobacteria bacterium]